MTGTRTTRRLAAALILALGAVAVAQAPAAAADTDDPQAAFQAANKAYFDGSYSDAAKAYADIIASHHIEDARLYHNLGNALFRSGGYGSAILYYRRAQRLEPEADVADGVAGNLDAARRTLATRYRADDQAQFVFAEPGSLVYKLTHVIGRTPLAVGFGLLWCAWLGLLILRRLRPAVRGFARAAVPVGIAAALAGSLLWGQVYTDTDYRVGVVVTRDATLREGRHETAQGVPIPEGMEVRIVEEDRGWTRVEMATGDRGWLVSQEVRQI